MIEVEKQDEVKFFKEVRMSDLTVEKKMELIQSLPQEADDMIRAHLMDYEIIPPTITEFLTDPFYAKARGDHLFPFWWDILKQYFVNDSRFYTSKFLLYYSSAVGSGKSFVSLIVAAYNLVRSCCRRNWFDWNGIDYGPVSIFCFNINLPKAQETLVKPLKHFISEIPFIQEHRKRLGPKSMANIVTIQAASQGNHSISSICHQSIISEIDARSYEDSADCLNKVYQRISSRNAKSIGYDTSLILDSQLLPGRPNSEMWLKQSGNIDKCFIVNAPHWKVREDLYKKNSPESPWFYVYAGDDSKNATVLPDDFDPLTNTDLTLDKDKIIHVPHELKSEFLGDIQLALCQKAAVSGSSGGNRFFGDIEALLPKFCLKQEFDDIYKLDFFEDQDYEKIFLSKLLDVIPKDSKVYIHIDVGLKNDHLGIGFTVCDKVGIVDSGSGKKVIKGEYSVVAAFGIKNKPNQENNLISLQNLLISLSKYRSIGKITMDSFSSRQMLQGFILAGLNAELLSMDRPASNYCLFKNLVLQGSVKLPKNSHLLSEMLGLIRDEKGKIDHESSMRYFHFFSDGVPKFTNEIVRGMKDICDGVSGSVVSAYNDGMEACATVEKEKKQNKSQVYAKLAQRNKFRNMTGNFGFF